jgi:fatty acid desaturase
MKASEVLTPSELQTMTELSDLHGFLAVGTTWGMIAGSFAIVAHSPHAWTIAIALVILGGRHLALAILMHDTSHYSLFKTRWLNDAVGGWSCAYPTWQDLRRYRAHHLAHHRLAGSVEDPDYDLAAPFPVTRGSMARKFLRDLSGLSGLKRLYGLILMDLGFVRYTVSSKLVRAPALSWSGHARSAVIHLHGVILANLVLFGILRLSGHGALYWLWILSWFTTFSLFIRIRAIAEHACTKMDLDPLQSTRTTAAGPLARVTVAPHRVNFHLEHHILPMVPSFRLPKLHVLLEAKGALREAFVSPGYLDVLKTASRRVAEFRRG